MCDFFTEAESEASFARGRVADFASPARGMRPILLKNPKEANGNISELFRPKTLLIGCVSEIFSRSKNTLAISIIVSRVEKF